MLHADETPWRERNEKFWMWVAGNQLAVLFSIPNLRSGEMARELLNDFDGTLISDRFSSYDWFETFCRQLCWSHLKRDFQAIFDRGDTEVGRGLLDCAKRVFQAYARFQKTRSRRGLKRSVYNIQAEFYPLLERGILACSKKTAGTCQHILDRYDALWTFKDVEGVAPDNNFAERELRTAVIWRKLSFGTQSANGSRYAERLLSVIATCRLQSIRPLDYLRKAVENHFRKMPPPNLLPAGA